MDLSIFFIACLICNSVVTLCLIYCLRNIETIKKLFYLSFLAATNTAVAGLTIYSFKYYEIEVGRLTTFISTVTFLGLASLCLVFACRKQKITRGFPVIFKNLQENQS